MLEPPPAGRSATATSRSVISATVTIRIDGSEEIDVGTAAHGSAPRTGGTASVPTLLHVRCTTVSRFARGSTGEKVLSKNLGRVAAERVLVASSPGTDPVPADIDAPHRHRHHTTARPRPLVHKRSSQLTLGVIGHFTINLGGHAVGPVAVGSRKARVLLALLAVQSAHMVPLWRIIDTLWPDARPRRPKENVATLVSRLRATLGTEAIVGRPAGYGLGRTVLVDIDQAAQLVGRAEAALMRNSGREARPAAESAVELLGRGEILVDHPGEHWIEQASTRHWSLLRRARHAAADAALREGYLGAAVAYAVSAVESDPFDEAAYRHLLTAHDRAGEPARALQAYAKLRKNLATELGVDPAPPTKELYVSILKANAAMA